MAEKKMTKKDWFGVLKEMVENSEMANKEGALGFIAHEVELLEKKSGSGKKTKAQVENEALMEKVAEVLAEAGKPMTVAEVMAEVGLSNQKVTSLLTKLKNAERVVRTEVKGKAHFTLA